MIIRLSFYIASIYFMQLRKQTSHDNFSIIFKQDFIKCVITILYMNLIKKELIEAVPGRRL